MNLKRIQKHIVEVTPTWEEFQSKNDGFKDVRFYAFTGGNGLFSAVGEVATVSDRTKLEEFMKSTNPPRPVDLRGLRVSELEGTIQDKYDTIEAEQAAPSNR